jgi:hypothetical protein
MGSCFTKPEIPPITTDVKNNSCPSECCDCTSFTSECCIIKIIRAKSKRDLKPLKQLDEK